MSFCSLWITCAASVPITAIEFIDGVGVCIVAVHGVACAGHVMLSTVLGILNSGIGTMDGGVQRSHHTRGPSCRAVGLHPQTYSTKLRIAIGAPATSTIP